MPGSGDTCGIVTQPRCTIVPPNAPELRRAAEDDVDCSGGLGSFWRLHPALHAFTEVLSVRIK